MINQTNNQEITKQIGSLTTINENNIQNPLIKRLIEEVRSEGKNFINAYDRTHSRHNRGR